MRSSTYHSVNNTDSTCGFALQVQSNAVWVCSSPKGFYQGNGGNRSLSEVTSDSHFHVPRRLVNQDSRPSQFFKQRELVLDVLNSLGLLMNRKIS